MCYTKVMRTTFIYFLQDPENPMKGYVGKTDNPKTRLRQHVKECREEKHRRANWLNFLIGRELLPTLRIVDEVPFEHWPQLEVAYIEFFHEQGYELVNGTPGGEDPPHTPEATEKNRIWRLGKKLTDSAKEKVRIFQRNKKKANNTSGFVGVAFDKLRKKWRARLRIAGREVALGRFQNIEDAVFVRRLAEDKYFA